MITTIKILALVLTTILLVVTTENDAKRIYRYKNSGTKGWAILLWISQLALLFFQNQRPQHYAGVFCFSFLICLNCL